MSFCTFQKFNNPKGKQSNGTFIGVCAWLSKMVSGWGRRSALQVGSALVRALNTQGGWLVGKRKLCAILKLKALHGKVPLYHFRAAYLWNAV